MRKHYLTGQVQCCVMRVVVLEVAIIWTVMAVVVLDVFVLVRVMVVVPVIVVVVRVLVVTVLVVVVAVTVVVVPVVVEVLVLVIVAVVAATVAGGCRNDSSYIAHGGEVSLEHLRPDPTFHKSSTAAWECPDSRITCQISG